MKVQLPCCDTPRVLDAKELLLPAPLHDFICVDDQPALDDFIRFESIESDFERICSRIGISCKPLPHKNRSRRGDYREYFDDYTRAYVGEQFRRDIDLFGYDY